MKILIRILVTIAIHIFLYLIGSFIAWDFNPLHWWLFTVAYSHLFKDEVYDSTHVLMYYVGESKRCPRF